MSRALTRNGSDTKQTRTAGKIEHSRRRQEEADLIALLATGFGRRYLHRIISRLWKMNLVPPELLGQAVGRHFVAQELLNEIDEVAPEAWVTMQREALERVAIERARSEPQPEEKTHEDETESQGGDNS